MSLRKTLTRSIILLAVLTSAFLTSAQDSRPIDWIPAETAGFMRLNLATNSPLVGLNLAAYVASALQPNRIANQAITSLDMLIPLTPLDVQGANFNRDIFPWLGSEILIAYRQFGDNLQVADEDLLFILPSRNALVSASSLAEIIQGQDLLERATYRDSTLYVGDRATIAITPTAVIIGARDLVEAALDLQVGEGISLIDEPAYRALAPHLADDALVSAYLKGDEAHRALSMIVSGTDDTAPLIAALGEALAAKRGEATFEQAVLGDSLGALAVSVEPDTLRNNMVQATLTLYDTDQPETVTVSNFDAGVLDLIPQNAMIVHTGTDAAGAVYDVLYTLPLTNFAGELLGGFPVNVTLAAANDLVQEPTSADIEAAVSGALTALDTLGGFNLDDDLLQHLSGSYAVALIPRPNNPSPLNTRYDVLIIARVSDADAAVAGLEQAAKTVFNLDALGTDANFQTLPADNPAILFGTVDDILIIGTGDAPQAALRALTGDNRLITRERWQSVSEDAVPHLYIDIPPIYNTFFPQAGAPTISALEQLGAHTSYLGKGVYRVALQVTLPGGF